MKKLTTLLLAAGMIFAASAPASAVDVKMDGSYLFQFTQGAGKNFDSSKFDQEMQMVRIGATFSVSEQLSGYMQIHSKWDWGRTSTDTGVNIAGEDPVIHDGLGNHPTMYMRQAYIDWLVPSTDIKIRMGRQLLALPALANGKNVALWWSDPADGIAIDAAVTDWLSLSAWWARYSRVGDNYDTHLSNAVDVATLAADFTYFDGFRFQPFFAFAAQGDGTMMGSANGMANGYEPGLTDITYHGGVKGDKSQVESNTYWVGFTGTMTYFDPFQAKLGFMYGDRDFKSSTGLPSNHGYFIDGTVSYKTAYGTPELLAFYGSGDDEDVVYAYQENMPSLVGRFKGSYGFFNGSGLEDNNLQNGHSGMGVWGVRAAWKNISFIEDLSHEFAVMYAQGTNDSRNSDFGLAPHKYMTTEDSIVEIDFSTKYNIYKNLTAYLEAAYIFEDFDGGLEGRKVNGRSADYDDAWKVALQFEYKF